ncbi:HemK2/MTQ2 family protein methyltransferase [Actinosynnema sp.]|uniref:HemK2/MTQ2 family protein methyltransferase n=1 Tax=Actinosynnema sp. TaxID=1872144 RepID=UPI003F86E49C
MLLLRPPGVYRPQEDTELLARSLAESGVPYGATVLDACTGTGALAVAAGRAGAGEVTAVDRSRRAVAAAFVNCLLHGVPVRVRHGDFSTVGGRYDVVCSNPPYVPAPGPPDPTGAARAWDAGVDGRAVLDRLCAALPSLLAPGGFGLVVHSALCGVERTLGQLRDGGLAAEVVASRDVGFGPVLRSRARWLEGRRLIAPGQRHERLVVVRADAP